jgi:hemerythrin-like metal-binding protein
VLGALLGELYAYAARHMTHEEDVLEQHKYPELESHRLEHQEFRRRLREYMEDLDSGRTPIALSLMQFLQEWLESHMDEVDRQYVEFLKAKGVH